MSKITIDIEARLASFESGLTAAQRKLHGFEGKLRSTASTSRDTFGGMAKGAAVLGTAISVATLAFTQFKKALEFGKGLDDLSELTGVTAAKLNELNYIAAGSGVAFETLATGMKKLSLSAANAADKGSDAAEAFRAIGIDPTKLGNLDKALVDIIFRLGKVADGSRRNQLANEFFGKSFDELVPLIRQGEDGFKKLQAEYEKLNLDPEKINALADKSDELAKNWAKLTANGAVLFAPAIEGLANLSGELVENQTTFQRWYEAIKDYVGRVNSLSPTAVARRLVNSALPENEGKQTFSGRVGGVPFNDDYSHEGRNTPFIPLSKAAKQAVLGGGGAKKDPFLEYSQGLQRMNAELRFSAENFEKFKGDTQANKVAAVEFDLALGKMSDASRKAEGLGVLSSKQKELALSTAQGSQALSEQIDKLKAMSTFDDYLNHLGTEISLLSSTADAREIALKMLDLEKDKITAGTKEYDDRIERLTALIAVRRQLADTDQLAAFNAAGAAELSDRQAEIDAIGKTTLEVLKLSDARRIDAKLRGEIFDGFGKQKVSDEQRTALEQAASTLQQSSATLVEKQYNKGRSAETGANNFFNKYIEDSQDAAKGVEAAFGKAFSGMEDALVELTTTGKLNFSSLVASIQSDLARIAVKQAITTPLANMLQGSMGGASSGAGAGGIFSGIASSLFGSIGSMFGFADGGLVSGAGTGTSDSILAKLSNGEFVMNASAVNRIGAGNLQSMNSGGRSSGGAISIFVNVPETMGRQSSSQLAQQIGAHVSRAQRRNG